MRKGEKLFRFQEEDMPLLLSRRHNLLASEMGTGKTVMAIEVINRLKFSKVLIICKASIKTHWQRKLEEWLTFPFVDIQIIQKKMMRLY